LAFDFFINKNFYFCIRIMSSLFEGQYLCFILEYFLI
jgi:hypothetical protein